MEFREKLKGLMKQAGLSQRGFASKYGIPTQTVEQWCAGSRKPPEYVQGFIQSELEREIRNQNVWESAKPVEKSSHIHDDIPKFYLPSEISAPAGALPMIDLFCGMGGFSLGCSWAGFFPVFGLDNYTPAIDTWHKHHPQAAACLGDIRRTDPIKVKALLAKAGIANVNLLTAGVPCQGFSYSSRKHHAEDERNFLFMEFLRYVKVFEPDYVILENVSGLRSTAGGQFEKAITRHIEGLGYSVTVQLVNAADYGVPQQRLRLFFVGVKNKSGLSEKYAFPDGNYTAIDYRTVSDALSDLPPLVASEKTEQYLSEPKTEYQRFLRGVGGGIIPEPAQLFDHSAPKHPPQTVERISAVEQGQPVYKTYRQRIRLSLDTPSPTLVAGGLRPQSHFWHPTQARGLTVREEARLQSFPDYYGVQGGITQGRVLVGNAVPPLLIYELAKPMVEDILMRHKER